MEKDLAEEDKAEEAVARDKVVVVRGLAAWVAAEG